MEAGSGRRETEVSGPIKQVSGWIGVDRWLLPALGTPWEPGTAFEAVLPHGEGHGPAPGLKPRPGTTA